MKSEKEIEQSLSRMIGRNRGLCLKWICPGFAGVPDRIVLLHGGRIIFVELKKPKGGRVSALQKWWRLRLQGLGFASMIIKNEEDIARFEKWIKKVNESLQEGRLKND